jgi:hypothetical protein
VGAYYYLIAQLPQLVYGQAAPMKAEAFKTLCAENLSSADRALLDLCNLDAGLVLREGVPAYSEAPKPSSSAYINRWRAWERALRLHLARLRFQRLKGNAAAPDFVPPAEIPEGFPDAALAAKAALAIESPLEAEFFLDKSRWDLIEALQGFDYFSVNTVFGYLLKLLLMERRSAFKVEEGFAEYKALYASIMEAAPDRSPVG